jgi:hypothetical protein
MPDVLDQLAFQMFSVFARFEYSLKASGFHNGNGSAKANWRKFAEAVADHFDNPQDEALKQAIRYILDYPPKKQMVVIGRLDWAPIVPNTDLRSDLVLLYVRCVRNNLFHGGKFNGHWFAPERSEKLLRHSLTILRSCLEASDDLKQAYDG